MSSLRFTRTELSAALAGGVRQCVVIGSRTLLHEVLQSFSDLPLQVFAVDEEPLSDPPAIFVPTQFASEALATALERSNFDRRKASLFVWLGGVGYRTVDAVLDSFSFIAALPQGSMVVFDYPTEHTSPPLLPHGALDALASRLEVAGNRIKYMIQPPAVMAMLRGLGFQKIADWAQEEPPGTSRHFVSAVV